MTPAVSVSSLTRKYAEIEVAAGETFGFLGPNGAGKSTTIKILCTLADPTSGSARVAGYCLFDPADGVQPPAGRLRLRTGIGSRRRAAQLGLSR